MRNVQNTLNAKLVFNSPLAIVYVVFVIIDTRLQIEQKLSESKKYPFFILESGQNTLATKCVSICLIPNNSPAFFGYQLGVLQLNSVLTLPGDRLRTQFHITVLHFQCQSPAQIVTCASHWLAVNRRFSQTPPQA